ncbi:metallophosphoesterase [Erwinia psidii]|uniref:Metallophosphoesterase n=1 Tax=Erwinia psidii TaxID=69224 RepID=A0A3N6S1U6_9GAMM|nr:metallophosphoesterase [Erwinia psidii]MCX8960165.1 metallophosphoesterase [Erwinia psidii]MCX8963712.1 metallophosphoesterase [Erwinia psidii]RQM38807.1 metallophosphoesterase [Erwinia psidii]
MKLAVISDIHGNVTALDAVLADIQKKNVDTIVNLGDICSGPLFPSETLDRVMALNIPTIRGNHERQLLELTYAQMSLSDKYAAGQLKDHHWAWLKSLPVALRLHQDLLLVHGTPENDMTYFLHTVTAVGVREATPEEITHRAGASDAKVILCGHTHLPRRVRLDNGCLLLNPGSVGLPAYADDNPYPHLIENGTPHARYAIITKTDNGWEMEFVAVEYDWAFASQAAACHGRDDWAKCILTGYC